MTPTLHIRLLGGPDIRLGEAPVHLETTKTLALLAYLVMRPGPHQREFLAGLLWGEQDSPRAARSLRRALWNIRHSLCPEQGHDTCPYLTVTRHAVSFNREAPCWLDVEEFRASVETAQQMIAAPRGPATTSAQVIEHLQRGAALYRGDFLEGLYIERAPVFETWLLGERAYYRERIVQVLSQLSEAYTARGEYENAILTLQRLLALAPWSEWAHRRLMFCYALIGRRTDALAQYRQCRRLLRQHLDVDPMPETVRLYERIRDPRQFTRFPSQPNPPIESGDLLPPIPFFGRGEEHAWLLSRWQERRHSLALVEGEAGIGKTRLVEEFLKYLSGHGVTVLRGRCYQFGHGAPFHPIADALRDVRRRHPGSWPALDPVWLVELARLLPELLAGTSDLPPPVPIEKDPAARQRLFEAVARALLAMAENGLALFLDDMHWADTDTVDMLHYLVHRLAQDDIWFVAACRGEELDPGHPFRLLRRDLGQSRRLQTLRLRPLKEESVRRALREWLALPDEHVAPLLSYLYERSRGNPFILVEYLRDLVERGILQPGAEGWHADVARLPTQGESEGRFTQPPAARTIPQAVQEMILTRVDRLPPTGRRLLNLAATVGEPFTRDLLLAAGQTSHQEVDMAVHTWLLRGLIQPLSYEQCPAYDFTHPLIRQVVYTHTPAPTRRRLHTLIAEALARIYAGREDQAIESLAYHFAQSENRQRAVPYLIRAGELARARQGPETAVEFYSRALEIIPDHDRATRYRALCGRERAFNQLARRDAQARDLAALWELAQQLGDPGRQAEVLFRRAEWAMRTSHFREGIDWATQARQLAMTHDNPGLAADALRIEGMCYLRVGDFAAGMECCEEALRISRRAGDRRREVLVLGTLAIAELDRGQFEKARDHMETALAYWRTTNEVWYHAIACNNLSMVYHRLGDYGRALELQQEARDLVPRTGDLGLDGYSLVSLGILYATVGRHEDALLCYKQAMDLAHVISDRAFQAYIYLCQGDVYIARGNTDRAEAEYRAALAIEEDLDVCVHSPQIWEGLARCALARGEWDRADTCLQRAHECHERTGYLGYFVSLALHAYVQAHRNEDEAARDLTERFLAWVSARRGEEEADPEAWWLISRTFASLGDHVEARRALAKAHAILQGRAATLEGDLRTSYLFHIPVHRDIIEAFSAV